jgi:hypothetical protein
VDSAKTEHGTRAALSSRGKTVRKERFVDTHLVPADTPRRPATASDLLDLLGVADAPLEEQRRAVGEWLRENAPLPLLLASLRKHGLIES